MPNKSCSVVKITSYSPTKTEIQSQKDKDSDAQEQLYGISYATFMYATFLVSADSCSVRLVKISLLNLQNKLLSDPNTIKMKIKVRRIHSYTAELEKTIDTKVIKEQTYCIFK
jgi:hypothetical protein